MAELVLIVGSPGAGKTTLCQQRYSTYTRISADDQGQKGHQIALEEAFARGDNIVIDKQNNIRFLRDKHIAMAKAKGYTTKIIWLKVDMDLCIKRMLSRKDHPNVSGANDVRSLAKTYLRNLQKPNADEADSLEEIYVPFYATIQDLSHLKGRIGVFGDLHGVWKETQAAMEELKLDHYVFLGDLNDRGPQLQKILDFVRNNPNAYSLEGNHENKLARWLIGNKLAISHGLQATVNQLKDYTEEQKLDLYTWIQNLPAIIKLPMDYVGVHAGFDPTRPLHKQKYATCLWIRHFGNKYDDRSDPYWFDVEQHPDLAARTILFGHNVLDEVHVAKNVRALDGGAVFGGELRVCVIDTEAKTETIHRYKCPKYYDKDAVRTEDLFAKKDVLVNTGYLTKSVRGDLVLYNYTDRCTYERSWSKLTLQSRGTIYNKKTGECIAKTFDKFFNLNETEDTLFFNLPLTKPYRALEKKDGSLGVLYKYEDQWAVATRGSFYSDQAHRATAMLANYNLTNIPKNVSLTFEIIYPENKIIVPYGDLEELVVLAAFNNNTGEELSWEKTCRIAKQAGFPITPTVDHSIERLIEMAKTIPHTEEGWVITFEGGPRVKIKGSAYVQMAKVACHVSPISVWEAMNAKSLEAFIQHIPEEIREEVEGMRDHIIDQIAKIKQSIIVEANRLGLDKYPIPLSSVEAGQRKVLAKETAALIKTSKPWMHMFLYHYLNQVDSTDDICKKLLRPTKNNFVDLDTLGEL